MRVSVVIPCRNGADLIASTLDSLFNQTLLPSETILVDNGSTDESVAIAETYGKRVSILSEPRPGASVTRNTGAAVATGDAIMFLDADDLLGPTALESLVAALADNTGKVACCPWYRFEPHGNCWFSAPPSCAPRWPWQDDLAAWLTGWYHPPCSVLWSREAYERTDGWSEDVKVNTDGDIMMRGFILGNRLVRTRAGAAYYRRLPAGQVSLSATRNTEKGLASRLLVLKRVGEMLETRSRLNRYRTPLGMAFDALAADSSAYPELQQKCLAEAKRCCGPPSLRQMRRVPADVASKLRWRAIRAHDSLEPEIAPIMPARAEAPAADTVFSTEHTGPKPKVTVIIPTFDRAHILPRAIDSVLEQSFGDFELLVIDDASHDETKDVVAQYSDPRLQYIKLEKNGGVAAARNSGIRRARGDYIAFLDSDDEWLSEKLALQVGLLDRLPKSTGLVYSAIEILGRESGVEILVPETHGYPHRAHLSGTFIGAGGSNIMIRKDVTRMIGFFDESLPAIEDFDFCLRVGRFFRIEFIDQPLVRYHDTVQESDCQAGDQRRSRNFMRNFQARHELFRRNRHEMHDLGVEHLFRLETAKRHLNWPEGNHAIARRMLLQGILRQPGEPSLYPWLGKSLLPARLRPYAGAFVRQFRNAFTPGPQLSKKS
ncbi:MAG: glycosyltransferase family A protein [Alphaproteobacteria bacterium]